MSHRFMVGWWPLALALVGGIASPAHAEGTPLPGCRPPSDPPGRGSRGGRRVAHLLPAHRRDGLLRRERWGARRRVVEERRDGGGHGAGQGHPPRAGRRESRAADGAERGAALHRDGRHQRLRVVEERWDASGHGDGPGARRGAGGEQPHGHGRPGREGLARGQRPRGGPGAVGVGRNVRRHAALRGHPSRHRHLHLRPVDEARGQHPVLRRR